jgi:SnoaL-like domain
MKEQTTSLINAWFEGLNRSDLESLRPLFCPSPRIRNASNPPLEGPHAVDQLLEDFFRRTKSRHFEVIDAAEIDEQAFAYWVGDLTFASGITIAGVELTQPLTVTLRGVERFRLTPDGRISEMDIIHETTTVAQAARAAATAGTKER